MWAIANVFGYVRVASDEYALALPVLAGLVGHEDDEVAESACAALAFAVKSDASSVQTLIAADVVPALVAALGRVSFRVQTAALRCISRILDGDADQKQIVIDAGAIDALDAVLSSPKRSLRKDALIACAKIANGNQRQVDELIQSGILVLTVGTLRSGPTDLKLEACTMLATLVAACNVQQINAVLDHVDMAVLLDAMMAKNETARTCFETLMHKCDTGSIEILKSRRDLDVVREFCSCFDDDADPCFKTVATALFKIERHRMMDICVALQAMELPALVTVCILGQTREGAFAAWHQMWAVAVKVKHFQRRSIGTDELNQ